MKIPLEIVFRGVERTDALEDLIREKTAKLEHVCGYIISCRVAIERPQLYLDSGSPYRIRIDMKVPPGHEIVIRRESGEGDLHDALQMMIRRAFDVASRSVRNLVVRQHGEVKAHYDPDRAATIVRLFHDAGYGFIRTPDGRDIYFHKNSVLHNHFDHLIVGSTVRFTDELGEMVPQATTVELVERPGINELEASTATSAPISRQLAHARR